MGQGRKTINTDVAYMEEDKEQNAYTEDWKSNLLKPFTLVIILGILIIIIFQGKWGTTAQDTAQWYGLLIIGTALILKGADSLMKHKTSKIIWHGGHSTTRGNWKRVGNWVIFRTDEIRWGGLEVPGNKPFICPITAVNKVGDNFAITAREEITHEDKIPTDVFEYLTANGYKRPYRIGYVDEDQLLQQLEEKDIKDLDATTVNTLNRPNVQYLISAYKESQGLIKMLSNVIDLKYGGVEKFIAASGRIMTKAERGSLTQKLKEYMVGER